MGAHVNALAEWVNVQLEGEYSLDGEFANVEAVEYALGEVIHKYNHCRPHGSLSNATLEGFHAHPERFKALKMAWEELMPETAAEATESPSVNPKPDDEKSSQPLSELLPPP